MSTTTPAKSLAVTSVQLASDNSFNLASAALAVSTTTETALSFILACIQYGIARSCPLI